MSCLAAYTEMVAEDCLAARAELAGRFSQQLPDLGISRSFSLPRARLELAGGYSIAQLHLAATALRSGGEEGYIGIAGEAIVPALQVAEARVEYRGFLGGVGLVDDPWTVLAERGWLRAVAPSFAEESGWMNRSDLGLWLGYRRGPLVVRADLSAGEGAFLRERNEEKNLAGTVLLRPIPALAFVLYGRQGFTGLQAAASHRVGGQAHVFLGNQNDLQLGLEVLQAWGVAGDEELNPLGGSLWAVGSPWGPLRLFARGDLASEELGDEDATSGSLRVGAGAAFGPARVLAGWDYRWAGDSVALVAGAGESTDVNTFYVQLDVDLKWEKP